MGQSSYLAISDAQLAQHRSLQEARRPESPLTKARPQRDTTNPLLAEARLTTKQRNNLPKSSFALSGGRYPIPDEAHARNALARVAQNGTPAEQSQVKAAVRRKYPDISVGGDDSSTKSTPRRSKAPRKSD